MTKDYEKCANDNEYCKCDGYVGYGPNDKDEYKLKYVTGGLQCSSSIFGDIQGGVKTQCQCMNSPYSGAGPILANLGPGWDLGRPYIQSWWKGVVPDSQPCAEEGEFCKCRGYVGYGPSETGLYKIIKTSFNSLIATQFASGFQLFMGAQCTNEVFGNVNHTNDKHCKCLEQAYPVCTYKCEANNIWDSRFSTCQTCKSGYLPNPKSQKCDKQCGLTEIKVNGECVNCTAQKKEKIGSECVPCKKGGNGQKPWGWDYTTSSCKECGVREFASPSDKTCKLCNDNEVLNVETNTCVECIGGFGNDNNECECTDKTHNKDANKYKCEPKKSCGVHQILIEGECTDCGDNQIHDAGKCYDCIDTTRKANKDKNSCMCEDGQYLVKVSENSDVFTKCVDCKSGEISLSNFSECINCKLVLNKAFEGNSCINCTDGKGMAGDSNKCTVCKEQNQAKKENFCVDCENDQGTIDDGPNESPYCQVCSVLSREKRGNKCVECGEREQFNLSDKKCQSCKDYQQWDSENKICSDCKVDEAYDISNNQCNKCNINEQVINKSSCETCPEGTVVGDDKKCQKCPIHNEIFYEDGKRVCRPCENNEEVSEIYTCKVCNVGEELNNQMKCEKCEANFVVDQKSFKCVECKAREFVDPNTGLCKPCPSNEVLRNGECFDCREESKVINEDQTECVNCKAGFGFSDQDNKCVKCTNDDVHDLATNKCAPCPANTINVSGECVTCNGKAENNHKCVCKAEKGTCECLPHQIVNPISKECEDCKDTEIMFMGKCVPCNHTTSKTQNNVCQCPLGTILSKEVVEFMPIVNKLLPAISDLIPSINKLKLPDDIRNDVNKALTICKSCGKNSISKQIGDNSRTCQDCHIQKKIKHPSLNECVKCSEKDGLGLIQVNGVIAKDAICVKCEDEGLVRQEDGTCKKCGVGEGGIPARSNCFNCASLQKVKDENGAYCKKCESNTEFKLVDGEPKCIPCTNREEYKLEKCVPCTDTEQLIYGKCVQCSDNEELGANNECTACNSRQMLKKVGDKMICQDCKSNEELVQLNQGTSNQIYLDCMSKIKISTDTRCGEYTTKPFIQNHPTANKDWITLYVPDEDNQYCSKYKWIGPAHDEDGNVWKDNSRNNDLYSYKAYLKEKNKCDMKKTGYTPGRQCRKCAADEILGTDPNDKLVYQKCTKCRDRQELDTNAHECKDCKKNQTWLNGKCIECENYKVVKENKCVNCDVGYGYQDFNDCGKCRIDEVQNPATNKCESCLPSGGINVEGECQQCYNGKPNEQNKCICSEKHEKKSENECKPCEKHQIVENDKCVDCKTDEIMHNGKCVKCENTTEKPIDNVCQCPDDFKLINNDEKDTPTKCQKCKTNEVKENNTTCTNCNVYYQIKKDNKCVNCQEKGQGFYDQTSKCEPCDEYNMIKTGNRCKECQPGTMKVTVENNSKCIRCSTNGYYHTVEKTCIDCSKDKQKLNQAGDNCDACPPGTIFSSKNLTCLTCSENKISFEGKCKSCGPHAEKDSTTNTCKECNDNAALVNGKCQTCPSLQKLSDDKLKCVCKNDTFRTNTGCKCPRGQYPQGDDCVCPLGMAKNGLDCKCPSGTNPDGHGGCVCMQQSIQIVMDFQVDGGVTIEKKMKAALKNVEIKKAEVDLSQKTISSLAKKTYEKKSMGLDNGANKMSSVADNAQGESGYFYGEELAKDQIKSEKKTQEVNLADYDDISDSNIESKL